MRRIIYNNKTNEVTFGKPIKEEPVDIVLSIEEKVELIQNELNTTQVAIDFILMGDKANIFGLLLSDNTNDIESYFAMRILKEKLQYEDVVLKYPELKNGIDFILNKKP